MANVVYNQKFHDDWAWSLAIRGATDAEIAEAMHVSRKTIAHGRLSMNPSQMRWPKVKRLLTARLSAACTSQHRATSSMKRNA